MLNQNKENYKEVKFEDTNMNEAKRFVRSRV